MSGHAKEGEKNTSVEALLHVNDLRGRGHPLVELSGDIVQVGVQALLQSLVEDNLSQATEDSKGSSLRPKGVWVDCAGLTAHQPWTVANTPTPRDQRGINEPRAKHEFLKMTCWKALCKHH